MKRVLPIVLAMISSVNICSAQSLKPEIPAPLQTGINKGTVDNFVGTHYWYFIGDPGKVQVHAQFKSMGLLGNASKSDITVTLSDEGHTWHQSKVLSSISKIAECTFDGDLKKRTKVIVTVAPPCGGLVRMGGDYELECSGTVSYGAKSTADPIVRVYNQMSGYTSLLGASKFLADGTVQTASGASGKWKLFDADSHTYVIDIEGQERKSVQYIPGRGLCDPDGGIVFQELK